MRARSQRPHISHSRLARARGESSSRARPSQGLRHVFSVIINYVEALREVHAELRRRTGRMDHILHALGGSPPRPTEGFSWPTIDLSVLEQLDDFSLVFDNFEALRDYIVELRRRLERMEHNLHALGGPPPQPTEGLSLPPIDRSVLEELDDPES